MKFDRDKFIEEREQREAEIERDARDRRDRFAAAALTGLLLDVNNPDYPRLAEMAVLQADALLAELDGAVPRAPEKEARAARALHRIAFEPFGPATADADHVLDLITRFAREELAALDKPVTP